MENRIQTSYNAFHYQASLTSHPAHSAPDSLVLTFLKLLKRPKLTGITELFLDPRVQNAPPLRSGSFSSFRSQYSVTSSERPSLTSLPKALSLPIPCHLTLFLFFVVLNTSRIVLLVYLQTVYLHYNVSSLRDLGPYGSSSMMYP